MTSSQRARPHWKTWISALLTDDVNKLMNNSNWEISKNIIILIDLLLCSVINAKWQLWIKEIDIQIEISLLAFLLCPHSFDCRNLIPSKQRKKGRKFNSLLRSFYRIRRHRPHGDADFILFSEFLIYTMLKLDYKKFW